MAELHKISYLRNIKIISNADDVLLIAGIDSGTNEELRNIKGMLYPRGNSELMCYKLPTIPREIF